MLYRLTCITGVCFAKREARDTSAERAKGVGGGGRSPEENGAGGVREAGKQRNISQSKKAQTGWSQKNGTRIRGYGKQKVLSPLPHPPPHIIQFVYVWPLK